MQTAQTISNKSLASCYLSPYLEVSFFAVLFWMNSIKGYYVEEVEGEGHVKIIYLEKKLLSVILLIVSWF